MIGSYSILRDSVSLLSFPYLNHIQIFIIIIIIIIIIITWDHINLCKQIIIIQ